MILGQNLFLACESQTIFCSIRNVLENYDLCKRHKIWAKLHCSPGHSMTNRHRRLTTTSPILIKIGVCGYLIAKTH